jgi:hypothetical protein
MIECGEGLGLAFEAFQTLGVRGHLRRQHLQRDLAAEGDVGRAKDFAHATCADRRFDAVVAEQLADQMDSPRWPGGISLDSTLAR